MPIPIPEVEFGSRADAAAVLKCSIQTVDRHRRRGELTAHKLGPRLVRFDMAEVRALLTSSTTADAMTSELSTDDDEAEAEWIKRCVDRSPDLTPARRARLRAILTSGSVSEQSTA